MHKILTLATAVLLAIGSLSAQKMPLNLDNIVDGKYYAERIYGVRPMNDGESYTQLSEDQKCIVKHSFKTGKETGVLFNVATARGPVHLDKIDGYILSPDESKILLQTQTKRIYRRSFTAVYYIFDIHNQKFVPLSEGGPQQVPLFSPDGTMIAFARNNNLFLVKLLFDNAESQITHDGKFNEVINGTPDWVNEEEFSNTRSFDFSADSKMLAWIRYDESRVPIYTIQEYKGEFPSLKQYSAYPGEYNYKYPVAGVNNSTVTVHAFDIKNRVARTLKVPLAQDAYIPRIKFTSDPQKLAVVTLNRHQSLMNIYAVNPRSAMAKLIVSEKGDKYIEETAYENLKFYPGCFAFSSDRSGYTQLYLYNLNGQLIRPLTHGKFDVTDFYAYNPKTEECYYAAAAVSPIQREVYVSDKHGKVRKLSSQKGTNSAIFSKNQHYYMNVYSNMTTPPITTLNDSRGKVLTTLLSNEKLKKEVDKVSGQKEFFTFKTSDGVELNGWMMKPKDFNPDKKYPVIMYQYSGPGSQSVKDSWSEGFFPGGLLESYMTEKGYICVIVDGRGTGYRGSAFEKCTYLHLGKLESNDQVETALYLGKLPYVDASRIGIWGWSFGGFNTLMSMSDPRQVFKAGVAIAAPTDWRYYDTIYTERYMQTPKENKGYDDNPISRAGHLHGALLLVHGTADDNVHYQNCTEYSEALVQANKQFDMQIYTNRNHFLMGGNTRRHLFHRIMNFFLRNL